MPDPIEPLILDLLEWIGPGPRPYGEVLEAWRTSCPRLPVWEEANKRGFIDHLHEQGHAAMVVVSVSGLAYLTTQRRNGTAVQRSSEAEAESLGPARAHPPDIEHAG